MTASVGVNPKRATDYKHPSQLPVDLRIDGSSMDLSALYNSTSTLNSSALNFVTGTVKTDVRNATGDVTAFFRGAGNAMEDPATIETCTFEDSCYKVKILPAVTEISHNAGHAEGGQLLTIKGVSLDGATVKVTVDDVECQVESVSQTEVTCTTGKKDMSTGA